jgi:hypothetical protein
MTDLECAPLFLDQIKKRHSLAASHTNGQENEELHFSAKKRENGVNYSAQTVRR